MIEWQRRIVLSLSAVALLVFVYTLFYQWAMLTFEGVEIAFFDSLQVVIETLTTAGFGGDTEDWNTAIMNLIVVWMNLSGVLLVFLALPLFVVPLFQQALEDNPQESTELTDHVIIYSYNPREDVLRSKLEAADVPYVIIDDDPETVLDLNTRGIEAICGDPGYEQTFRAANINEAQALVADVSDEENISVILTARELREDLMVVSVAENKQDAEYHRYAGADQVIRPRQALGRALGNKATLSVTKKLQETIEIGDDFELAEILVEKNSDLAGQTLAELKLPRELGITVNGIWSNGEFSPAPEPNTRIKADTILLVAGSHEALQEVKNRAISPMTPGGEQVIVAGYGVVGQAVIDVLETNDVSPTVVDITEDDRVDITGDINQQETLSESGVENASVVVLALDADTTTMYATVAIEELAPDVEVITRVNDVENTAKLYRAGAEYVLALSTVTGRMVSSVLLEDEEVLTPETQLEVLTPETQFEIIRTTAPELVGRTLNESAVRNRTGATVVAIERNGELLTNPGAGSVIKENDRLIVTGSDDAVNAFITTFR